MEEEKLNELYDFVISHDDLTTKDLRNLNFNYRKQCMLINNGILKRVRIGHYMLINHRGIFFYGQKLLEKGEYKKAWKCFDKSHEIKPNSNETLPYLFAKKVYQKNYMEAYNYLKLQSPYKGIYNNDNNLFLILLSHLIKLPEDDCYYAKCLDFEDLSVGKNRKRNRYNNKIRYYIANLYFECAIKNMNQRESIKDLVTYRLLCDINSKNIEITIEIKNMIKNQNYQDVINLLEEEQKYHRLIPYQSAILDMCKDIVYMKENNKTIPPTGEFFDIYGNIYGHNYKLAKQKMEKKYSKLDNSVIYILINECISLRDHIDHIDYIDRTNKGIIVNYFTLACDLYSEDYESFFDNLHFYLYSIDKLQYEDKFAPLVEAYKKEDDKLSLIPMKYLELIQGDNSPSIHNFFIEKFNNSMNSKDSESVKIYFDIIEQINQENNGSDEKKPSQKVKK